MKRPTIIGRSASLLLGLAALLTACGGSAAVSTASSSTASSAAVPSQSSGPASSAAASAPTSAGAAGASAPAASAGSTAGKGPIKIGVLGPMTGPDSINGTEHREGVNLYLSSIHSTVAGRTIQPIFTDTQAKADVALTKAKELVENQHVQMLMGLSTTPACYAVAGYAKQANIPLAVTINCGAQYLTVDPKFASPDLARFTQVGSVVVDSAADWAYKAGHRKAILITDDYGGGIETADLFASQFILHGGSIVQEMHPAIGTTDYGPFLAQLKPGADLIVAFLIGTDSLKFGQQYANYAGKKRQILDLYGQITAGPYVAQLQDKALGIVSAYVYSKGIDTPENQAFLKAFHAKYPGQHITAQVAQGYAGMQAVAAAIKAVNGNVESKQAFLTALDKVNVQTVKGPVKLDQYHDAVQNNYIYQVVKQGGGYGEKVIKTYNSIGQFWDRTKAQLQAFKAGTHKGQWVGATKATVLKMEGGS